MFSRRILAHLRHHRVAATLVGASVVGTVVNTYTNLGGMRTATRSLFDDDPEMKRVVESELLPRLGSGSSTNIRVVHRGGWDDDDFFSVGSLTSGMLFTPRRPLVAPHPTGVNDRLPEIDKPIRQFTCLNRGLVLHELCRLADSNYVAAVGFGWDMAGTVALTALLFRGVGKFVSRPALKAVAAYTLVTTACVFGYFHTSAREIVRRADARVAEYGTYWELAALYHDFRRCAQLAERRLDGDGRTMTAFQQLWTLLWNDRPLASERASVMADALVRRFPRPPPIEVVMARPGSGPGSDDGDIVVPLSAYRTAWLRSKIHEHTLGMPYEMGTLDRIRIVPSTSGDDVWRVELRVRQHKLDADSNDQVIFVHVKDEHVKDDESSPSHIARVVGLGYLDMTQDQETLLDGHVLALLGSIRPEVISAEVQLSVTPSQEFQQFRADEWLKTCPETLRSVITGVVVTRGHADNRLGRDRVRVMDMVRFQLAGSVKDGELVMSKEAYDWILSSSPVHVRVTGSPRVRQVWFG